MMLHRIRRDGSRGQALVEFALVVPIFVLLLVGLFDIGRAVWNYNTVANAAREAARVAVVNQDQTVIREAAKTAGVSLSLEDADITLNPCTDQ
jgi:Flp pilus assembly protein TadG